MSAEIPSQEHERRSLPPLQLRQVQFKRSVRGYDADDVDAFLARVQAGYEDMWRQRRDLEIEAADLRAEVERLSTEYELIRQVLITAQRTADEIVETAQKDSRNAVAEAEQESERMLEQARLRAEAIVGAAETRLGEHTAELERVAGLSQELRAGYKAFLLAALELLEAHSAAPPDVTAPTTAAAG